ncbi:unnamed protein product, partial [marine sediment metagenome]
AALQQVIFYYERNVFQIDEDFKATVENLLNYFSSPLEHPPEHVILIELASDLALEILNRTQANGGDWAVVSTGISRSGVGGGICSNIRMIHEEIERLETEKPRPPQKRLESIAELEKLPNINDRGIAMAVGWRTEEGEPDARRVDQFRNGEPDDLGEKILWPDFPIGSTKNGPTSVIGPHQLHLGLIQFTSAQLEAKYKATL